ncbi:transposase, partial [Enterococcus sp. PFB1-1]|uniref:transposase n=2 Tax=unclassified Enterococcus TaxID=2608891 RepID=UPI002476B0B9
FVRVLKEYHAEKLDENQKVIPEALTPKGYLRKISVNPAWEYHKAKQAEMLSARETSKIYARRKIDVETVFGFMKACLGFTRYTVRGIDKVRKQSGILITAINMMKLSKVR